MTAPPVPDIDRKPRSLNWRKKASRLPRQYIERQGLIANLAYTSLGCLEAAVTFLNSYHARLRARPLDLAGDSAAGYLAVQGEVQRLASNLIGERQ